MSHPTPERETLATPIDQPPWTKGRPRGDQALPLHEAFARVADKIVKREAKLNGKQLAAHQPIEVSELDRGRADSMKLTTEPYPTVTLRMVPFVAVIALGDKEVHLSRYKAYPTLAENPPQRQSDDTVNYEPVLLEARAANWQDLEDLAFTAMLGAAGTRPVPDYNIFPIQADRLNPTDS